MILVFRRQFQIVSSLCQPPGAWIPSLISRLVETAGETHEDTQAYVTDLLLCLLSSAPHLNPVSQGAIYRNRGESEFYSKAETAHFSSSIHPYFRLHHPLMRGRLHTLQLFCDNLFSVSDCIRKGKVDPVPKEKK